MAKAHASAGDAARAGTPDKLTPNAQAAGEFRLLGRVVSGMPLVDPPDDEFAALTAAIRGVIEDAKYPLSPKLDALKAALARLEAASNLVTGPTAPHPKKSVGGCGFEPEGPGGGQARSERGDNPAFTRARAYSDVILRLAEGG